ncbi:MAG: NAD(P)/FAD-dependent oxidoreductase [Lachnospiraceae bacterium]|nr:NAD(P)/FAD-dependent oxidoreductase [Lachnospiraceae bacterium]
MSEVIVVGGGAAGMMAAYAAARKGHQVTLLEKNEKLGKKLYITGKGRCNITNAADLETIMAHIVSNPRFLYSSLYGFTNQDMVELLNREGLETKVERGMRVFPVSDKSSDVIRTLSDMLHKSGVRIYLNKKVTSLILEETGEKAESVTGRNGDGKNGGAGKNSGAGKNDGKKVCTGVVTEDGRRRKADVVIVTTGGISYPSTGSTGDGYRFAEEAGHQITALSPALVPFTAEEEWVKELQGLSLRNVNVTITSGKKKLYTEFGEMLFTHFGVSGPAVLSGSSVCAKHLKKGKLTLHIDLKPALDREQLDARFLREFKEAKNKQISNVLGAVYPSSLVPVILKISGIAPDKVIHDVTREDRNRLIQHTKDFCMTLNGLRGYGEAIITQGGIRVKEINPATMESKLVQGLRFAGEVLDVDAFTGGYNLQIAWSTGWAAGSTIE